MRLEKPVGSDLRQGTITLPVFYYLDGGGDRSVLTAVFNEQDPERKQEALTQALDIIRSSGAIDAALQEAWDFAKKAQAALDLLPDTPYRAALYELAEYVVQRTY